MIELFINNKPVRVEENTTILKAAETLGIKIPTLCYMKGFLASSSCMVCVVLDKNSDKIVPACSALCIEGMNIETENEELLSLRKNAVQLLLSEHSGDCIAPCQNACPAHINIPLMNRLIADEQFSTAKSLLSEFKKDVCSTCNIQCEKVCRRKNIDEAVAIKKLIEYLSITNEESASKNEILKSKKNEISFNSSYGRMRENEKSEFLKEAENKGRKIIAASTTNSYSKGEAVQEASRCMHCDCRKNDECNLRIIADQFQAKQRAFIVEDRNNVSKIFHAPLIVLEPQKCIKCGVCIQITNGNKDFSFSFREKSFQVQIELFYKGEISDSLISLAKKCIEHCPTGAISAIK
mgnify:CR=1 FL=1